jgi:hypothetical protein
VTVKDQTAEWKDLQQLQLEGLEFMQYLEREASCTDQFYTTGDRLYFYHEADRYSYKLTNRSIVRQINAEGYIIVCFDVEKLNFVIDERGLQVHVNLARGKKVWKIDSYIPYHRLS